MAKNAKMTGMRLRRKFSQGDVRKSRSGSRPPLREAHTSLLIGNGERKGGVVLPPHCIKQTHRNFLEFDCCVPQLNTLDAAQVGEAIPLDLTFMS